MPVLRVTPIIVLAACLLTSAAHAADGDAFRPGAKVRVTVRQEFDAPGVAELVEARLTPAPGARNLRNISAAFTGSLSPDGPAWWSVETAEGQTVVLPVKGQTITGTLVALSASTMTLSRGGQEEDLVLPLTIVKDTQVSVGHRSRAGQTLKGALIGAGVGVLLGAISGDDPPVRQTSTDWAQNLVAGLFWTSGKEKAEIGAILLAPVGAIVGAVLDVERWKTVKPGEVRLAVSPAPKGAGLSLTFGFKGRHAR